MEFSKTSNLGVILELPPICITSRSELNHLSSLLLIYLSQNYK